MQIEWRANIFWELPSEIATEIFNGEALRLCRFLDLWSNEKSNIKLKVVVILIDLFRQSR